MQGGKHLAQVQSRLTPLVMPVPYNTLMPNGSALATTVAYLPNQSH
jgi:hypothetical protein